MKSKLVKILIIVVVLLVLLYVGLNFFVGSLAKTAINRYGPMLTQTKVTLSAAEVSPFSGNGTLVNLFVGNPPGWSSDKAFSFGSIHVEIVPSSIFKDHIVVKEVKIEKPEFVYETKFVSSNISELLKRIEGTASSGHAGQATSKSGQPLKFAIGHLVLTGGTVTLGVGPTAITVPMPPIELSNLGGNDNGITSDQLAVAVMRAVSTDVLQTVMRAAGKVGSNLGGAAGDAAQKAATGIKGLFGH